MPPVYDLRLGRLALPTLLEGVKETVGDPLAAVGAVSVPGERSPTGLPLTVPVYASPGEADPEATGLRLRRQLRALLRNPRARAEGLWLAWTVDPELDCWVLVGRGELVDGGGGVTFGDFRAELGDVTVVGSPRTHRLGRRLEARDRRLAVTPRDHRGTLLSTDFAAQTAEVRHHLPVGVTDVTGRLGRVVVPSTRASAEGPVPYVVGALPGEAVTFEQPPADRHKADVTILDRRPGGAGAGYASRMLARAGLLLHLRLGETSGTVARDASPNARDGTYGPGVTLGQAGLLVGDPNGSVLFPTGAANRKVTVPYVPWTGQRTFEGLAHLTGAPNIWALFGGDASAAGRAALAVTGTDVAWNTGTGGSSVTWAAAWPAGDQTVHWALAYDFAARIAELWVNGTSKGTRAPAANGAGADGLAVGWADGSIANPMVGRADELAVFSGLVPSSEIAADHAASVGSATAAVDEEAYGPDHPLTAGDVPTLENGICRVRWEKARGCLSLHLHTGGAYVEAGRAVLLHQDDAQAYTVLTRASVVEWTPERAVVLVSLSPAGGGPARCELYVTLQRGWAGPRLEAYVDWDSPGTRPRVVVRLVPATAGATTLGRSSGTAAVVADTGYGTFAALEPWAYLLGPAPDPALHLAVLQAGADLFGKSDSLGYGAPRNGVSLLSPPVGGYLSATLGLGARGAETADAQTLGRTNLHDCRAVPELHPRG